MLLRISFAQAKANILLIIISLSQSKATRQKILNGNNSMHKMCPRQSLYAII